MTTCFMCEEEIKQGSKAYKVDMTAFTCKLQKYHGIVYICEDCLEDFLFEYSISFYEYFANRFTFITGNDRYEINYYGCRRSEYTHNLIDWLDRHPSIVKNCFIEEVAEEITI